MKKLLFVGLMLLASQVKADLITSTLLDHVGTVSQFKSGETSLALVDSVVQIGSFKGRSILDLQAGFSTDVKPAPGEEKNSLIAGGFFKLSSLFVDKISLPLHWEFLRSLEYGPAYFYSFQDKEDFVCFQVGLAFDLNPLP